MYLEARQIATILFQFTDQICEQSGYAMTLLPVLQNHSASSSFISASFKSNIFYLYRTSFNQIEHPLVLPNIFYLCRTSFSFIGHL